MKRHFKNIFHQITYKILMKNKTRTVVTIIGIILSTALITAISTFVSSLQNSMLEYKISERGNWHAAVMALPEDTAEELQQSEEITWSSVLHNMGYATLESGQSSSWLQVSAADAAFYQTIPIEITNGRMPRNAGEIILPAELAGKLPEDILNTVLTLELGIRMDQNGNVIKANSYETKSSGEEKLRVEQQASYTVVGVYKSSSSFLDGGPAYPVLTCEDESNAGYDTTVYVRLKNVNDAYQGFIGNYAKNNTVQYNTGLLKLMGSSKYTGVASFVIAMASIVVVLVMAGSVLVIFNSFAISLSERMKQFGLLSSIGATKAQLRRSVLFEAFFVSLIGIPMGVVLGISGIGATLFLIRTKLQNISASMVSLGKMNLSVSWTAVLIAVLAAGVTVLIAAFIPMVRISKMSAIDVIRQKEDVRLKAGKVRAGKIFYRVFGLEGMMARKNFKRSRRKYRTTVISLFVSVVLFIAAVSFGDYLVQSVQGIYKTGVYDIKYSRMITNDNDNESAAGVIDEMKKAAGVTEAGTAMIAYSTGAVHPEDLTGTYRQYYSSREYNSVNGEETAPENNLNLKIYGVEDDIYRSWLAERNLSKETFMEGEQPHLIAFAKSRTIDEKTGKITVGDIFEKSPVSIKLSFTDEKKHRELLEKYKEQLKLPSEYTTEQYDAYVSLMKQIEKESYYSVDTVIGCFTEELPYTVDTSVRYDGIVLVCPMSVLKQYVDPEKTSQWTERTFFKTTDHTAAFEEMKTILERHNLVYERLLLDEAMEYEATQSTVFVVRVFAAGFIVLMSLIAVANVFNTMSTNMMLRRREFAMLKTIGMTDKGFNRMLYYECIMYGAKALLFGIPVALLFTWWIYKSVSEIWSTGYQVPWMAIAVAVISVFAVVLATMMYSKRKINQMNMLDVIKDENI